MNVNNNVGMNTHYAASKLCRACLSDHEDMQDIFQTCFAEVFEYCTSLRISVNDGLPCAMCRNCVSLLSTLYYFKQQCIRSDETLRQIIAPQVAGNIKEEEALIDTKYDTKYDICTQPAIESNFQLDNETNIIEDRFVCNENGEFYDQKSMGCDLSNLAVESLVDIVDPSNLETHLPELQELPVFQSNEHNIEKSIPLPAENPTEITFNCEICSEVFCNTISLKKHVKEKHTNKKKRIKIKQPAVKSDLLTAKSKTSQRPKTTFKCPKCDKQFKVSHRLDAHVREHYGLKPFDCRVCYKEFSNWRTLKMHMNLHSGQKKYVCDVCQKAFTYPTVLDIHKKIHKGVKKYTCTVCDASFVQSGQLKNHMTTHTSEKPFSCTQCNKQFKSSNILKSHMERHKGVKNFVCSICGKRFPTNGELTTHMRSHSSDKPFQCSVCKKSFKSNSLLLIHNRIHSGERPYKCQICPKEFMDSQVLKRHLTTHTDMKPHVCEFCHKSFGQKYSLKKHMKSHEQVLQGICFEFIDETREGNCKNFLTN